MISHCEDGEMVGNKRVMREKFPASWVCRGRPAVAEDLMVARDVMLAADTGGHVHIAHVSTKGAAQIIRMAKAAGVSVTAETCPQYFMMTEELLLEKGTRHGSIRRCGRRRTVRPSWRRSWMAPWTVL